MMKKKILGNLIGCPFSGVLHRCNIGKIQETSFPMLKDYKKNILKIEQSGDMGCLSDFLFFFLIYAQCCKYATNILSHFGTIKKEIFRFFFSKIFLFRIKLFKKKYFTQNFFILKLKKNTESYPFKNYFGALFKPGVSFYLN